MASILSGRGGEVRSVTAMSEVALAHRALTMATSDAGELAEL
jgi:hypothetical protein